MPSNARWTILVLVGVTGLAWFFAGRGPVGPQSHASCFSHRECAKGQLCAVVPKGDGFATMGVCGEPCESDAACPNGWRCAPFMETDEAVLVPASRQGATGPRRLVCAPPKRSS